MENDKVKTVKEWKTSTKIKEVENFLRFANFYRYFIKSSVIQQNFLMNSKERKNRNRKKNIRKIISQPVLTLSRREGKFRVETDILEHTIGRVLS